MIIILDFYSQYTQLIKKSITQYGVTSKIVDANTSLNKIKKMKTKGIIISGSPLSTLKNGDYHSNQYILDDNILDSNIPILGICYGMQLIAKKNGGIIHNSNKSEYGSAKLLIKENSILLKDIPKQSTVWMSHNDYVKEIPSSFSVIASTESIDNAIIQKDNIFCTQFHPEVRETEYGSKIIFNFIKYICNISIQKNYKDLKKDLNQKLIKNSIESIKDNIGNKKVICALSGGIDSTVAAVLVHKAIGNQMKCIFIDNGLIRYNESEIITEHLLKKFPLNVKFIDAKKRFLDALKDITDPEQKRKIIGKMFIKVFEEYAIKHNINILVQGTLLTDIIESKSGNTTIKTHHNVGGIPKDTIFKIVEPLRDCFKNEVRELAIELNIPSIILNRQPFPGPGLAIRIIGEITESRLDIIKKSDKILQDVMQKHNIYNSIWQALVVLLPIKSVGVMGDQRSYKNVLAVRCVNSLDGMTAQYYHMKYQILDELSSRIVNEVSEINRVVYDITSKPPSTIEWE